jgi:choline trimethylamine-lyase activating enzyme
MAIDGTIFNIQRFSIQDGPGVRTVVFFKGCNLACKWCHNPEAISWKNELEFYPQRCIGCGSCFLVCPNCAHIMDENQQHHINREKCSNCLLCTETCYANALAGVGKKVDTDYLLESIMTDYLYYKNSSGGVTFSGGECMLQIDFLTEILMKCKERGVHTALDTAGCVPWSYFQKIIPFVDLFLYDVKAADPSRHKEITGVSNELILQNLKLLSDSGKQIYVRIPFIPGFTDDQTEKIVDLLKPLHIIKVEVIPYHKLGDSKYSALDMKNEMRETKVPDEDMVERALTVLRNQGLAAEKS